LQCLLDILAGNVKYLLFKNLINLIHVSIGTLNVIVGSNLEITGSNGDLEIVGSNRSLDIIENIMD